MNKVKKENKINKEREIFHISVYFFSGQGDRSKSLPSPLPPQLQIRGYNSSPLRDQKIVASSRNWIPHSTLRLYIFETIPKKPLD